MVTTANQQDGVRVLSHEEGLALLEKYAQEYLCMTAQQFVAAWDAGTIEDPDRPEVIRLSMLLPLAR